MNGPLVSGRFMGRPNRFLVQVRIDGSGDEIEAHLADPGRLKELLQPGARIWVRPVHGSRRKTRWTAVMTEVPGGPERVSLDTTLPNRLIRRGLEGRALEEFAEFELARTEFSVGESRFDFLLEGPGGRRMLLEVKSVTLVEGGVGLFPDAVTARGKRHVSELAGLVASRKWEASVLFVLQRMGADRICAARAIDPGFADALAAATLAGVRVFGRRCRVHPDRVELDCPVPVEVR